MPARSKQHSQPVQLDVLDQRRRRRLDRQQDRLEPGPTPTASNGTDGDPDEFPALTIRLVTVKGSRLSTLSVVLPRLRRAGFDRDKR